jgi:membrane-bound metal-dependent hydrolase YbcI (DUF457 family)
MKWVTHIAMAFLMVRITEIVLMVDLLESYEAYAVVVVFAVLPDLDFILGVKHRTWTHTVWFTFVALVLTPLGWKMALAGWIAGLSHLIGDMMTHSGVRLFYPEKTVYYLLPPSWRIRTGGTGEFSVLGFIVVATLLVGAVQGFSDVERIFDLSVENVVTVSFSYHENGAVYHVERAKIVWSDGSSKIGFVDGGRLVKVGRKQIIEAKILAVGPKDEVRHARVEADKLRSSIWRNKIIVAYAVDGWKEEFAGTGLELWREMREKDLKAKLDIWYYDAR